MNACRAIESTDKIFAPKCDTTDSKDKEGYGGYLHPKSEHMDATNTKDMDS